ncbi:MAG: hypothetical protein ACYDCK_09570 [Thermoplasmatota archaeon]
MSSRHSHKESKRSVAPRSGRERTKWKMTAMHAHRDAPARPGMRRWLQAFLIELVFR